MFDARKSRFFSREMANESLSPLFYSKKPCSSCGGTKVNENALKACISSPRTETGMKLL